MGGALGGLTQGLVNGLEMRRQFQQAADQHEEFLQRQAQQQQTMQQAQHDASMKNIVDRMNLEMSGALPVNNGMVTDSMANAPADQSQAPAQSAPLSQPAATPAQPSLPLQRLNGGPTGGDSDGPNTMSLDALRSAVEPPAPAPAAAAPAQPTPAPAPASPGPYLRKADKSRVVSVSNPDGTKNEYELLTPQAQIQQLAQRKEAAEWREKMDLAKADDAVRQFYLKRRGVKAPDDLAKTLGIDNTNPNNLFLPDEISKMASQAAEWQKVNNANQPITLGPNGELPSTVPASLVPQTVRYSNNQTTNNTRAGITDANNETKTNIAIGNNATSEDNAKTRAGATTGAAKIRADAAANPKAPTGGQTGVQNRFDQKRLDAIAKEEEGHHATRNTLGTMLATGKDDKGADLTPAARTMLQARYNNATTSLQDAEFRKAGIRKTPQPTPAMINAMRDGGTAEMPDGHVWTKHGAVVYLTK